MQKPSTDIRKRILPHYVLQLQCIVDSFCASRGWTLDPFRGHVLVRPPRKFRPRRDVDILLHREFQKDGRGLLQSIDVLKQLLQKGANLHQDSTRHTAYTDILEDLKFDFFNWLGKSRCNFGLPTVPVSRFSQHNANGPWGCFSLLCATGLVQGIVLVQRVLVHLWDIIPKPKLTLHLHNMLVKKGFSEKRVKLYATLEIMFQDSFFPHGIPTDNSSNALLARTGHGRLNRSTLRQHQATSRDTTKDIHRLLDSDFSRFFKAKLTLMM
jgi:hypothetical protein